MECSLSSFKFGNCYGWCFHGRYTLVHSRFGIGLTSYPLLATGLVNTIKGTRGCKRLVRQHNASSLGFNPEFDFGLGMNAVSFYMNF